MNCEGTSHHFLPHVFHSHSSTVSLHRRDFAQVSHLVQGCCFEWRESPATIEKKSAPCLHKKHSLKTWSSSTRNVDPQSSAYTAHLISLLAHVCNTLRRSHSKRNERVCELVNFEETLWHYPDQNLNGILQKHGAFIGHQQRKYLCGLPWWEQGLLTLRNW
jgi:hypothetical protein